MEKINKIGKLATAMLSVGLVLLILMVFSVIGAFATINSDMQNEGNIFYGLPNQTSTLSTYNPSTNTAIITPELVKQSVSAGEEATVQMQFDVFKDAYINDEGHIIIQSNDEWNVVAPGASNMANNASIFTVKNESGQNVNINFAFEFKYNDDKIPLHFKAIDPNNNYLLGSADSFDDPLNINNIKQDLTIAAGETLNYQFPWYWDFYTSNTDDEYDTKLGYKAVEQPITVTLKVNAEEPSPVPPGPEPPYDPGGENSTQTGDIVKISLFGIISIILISSFFVLNKRKKKFE